MIQLVTGATGFLGSHVARLLTERGESVRLLVRPSSPLALIEDLPADLGPLGPKDFNLGRIRCIPPRPYPSEDFERTKAWMVGWNLIPPDASFEAVVDNRLGVA